jgi:hypothetical protein
MSVVVMSLALAGTAAAGLGLRQRTHAVSSRFLLALAVVGAVVTFVLHGPVWGALTAASAAATLVALIFLGVLNRAHTFMVPAVLAWVPLTWWWVFAPGLVLAAVVATAQVVRRQGRSELTILAVESTLAVRHGGPAHVKDLADFHATSAASAPAVHLMSYLAGSALLCAAITAAVQAL